MTALLSTLIQTSFIPAWCIGLLVLMLAVIWAWAIFGPEEPDSEERDRPVGLCNFGPWETEGSFIGEPRTIVIRGSKVRGVRLDPEGKPIPGSEWELPLTDNGITVEMQAQSTQPFHDSLFTFERGADRLPVVDEDEDEDDLPDYEREVIPGVWRHEDDKTPCRSYPDHLNFTYVGPDHTVSCPEGERGRPLRCFRRSEVEPDD